MIFGACNLSLVSVRIEPSHRSEIVTQLLFGDAYLVIEEHQDWMKIRITYDNYEGWIESKQHCLIDENEFFSLIKTELNLNPELMQVILNETQNRLLPILLGSSIPELKDKRFSIGPDKYLYNGNISEKEFNNTNFSNSITENAIFYLNAPYMWGGKTPFGIDCSGFTQMVYKLCNKKIPRDASQQAILGKHIYFITEAEVGDLIFFENEKNEIIHTGIYLGKSEIIHASGKVRIDKVDQYGIFNVDLQKYTHKSKIIKRHCLSL